MLVSIVTLGVLCYQQQSAVSFELADLLRLNIDPVMRKYLFFGFFVAFAVKIPLVPFHTWQPGIYAKAPAAIALFIAALLYQAGLYGFFRFGFTIFPQILSELSAPLCVLAVTGIIYASLLAWQARGLRQILAYVSIVHVAFGFLGLVALQHQSIAGGLFLITVHAPIAAGLFMLAVAFEERSGATEIGAVSGLAARVPAFSFFMVVLALAAISLPLTAGFAGEFMVLNGAFGEYPVLTGLALSGTVLGAVYMLGICRQTLFGPERGQFRDLAANEILALAFVTAAIIVSGLYPSLVLEYLQQDTSRAVNAVLNAQVESFDRRKQMWPPSGNINLASPDILKLSAE
jgi:NADH-quinone oxidoreductase subunit M